MSLLARYRKAVAQGRLKQDALQENAARKLQALCRALRKRPRWRLFGALGAPARGLYIWGDVGRGKSMLMDLFYEEAPVSPRRRVHFNAFMAETHARIHAERERGVSDPIPPVAQLIARQAQLLCFDEFQVTDVADAMILGRLFEQLFERRVTIVTTSNTAPDRLYEGGLNRELFLPFVALIKERLEIVELNGPNDYRRLLIAGLNVYLCPLGPKADAAMDEDWRKLTGRDGGAPAALSVLGRSVRVPRAADGVARFSFEDLCLVPLAGADYLAIARAYHTVFIDRIPTMTPAMRDAARRFTLLIDTLYDEGVKLVCSAAAPPERLYVEGENADAFRRTASRLVEMQSTDYLERVGR